jgi:FkbM family methyltransferase
MREIENFLKKKTVDTGRFFLNYYEIDGTSGLINLHVGSLTAFTLEQYAYRKENKVISVQQGDIVLDGGSCWGDTTLYFADKVGTHGKVYAFEFVKNNLEILFKNINLNPHLKNRVDVVQKALWDVSGEILEFYPNRGPSTRIGIVDSQIDNLQASSISIDTLVQEKEISKIDFIKMDVEGSELKALQGAEKTIQKFKPKLAISIYHKNEDFYEIPLYINSLALGYEFYIDHFTIHREETILFAESNSR